MYLDIEAKSEELAKGVVEFHPEIKEAEGVIEPTADGLKM